MRTGDDRRSRIDLERDAMAWPAAAWDSWDDGALVPAEPIAAPSGVGLMLREVVQTLVLAAILFAGIRVVVQNYMIESYSMEPTLYEGQHIWVNKVLYNLTGGPERGDIVVFQAWDQEKPFIKRVIGLPGEVVDVRDGDVFVDGEVLNEPYLDVDTVGGSGPVALGPEEYFVLGDNRDNSGDSRYYGPLPEDGIVGKAWVRYWPVDAMGLLHDTGRSFAAGQ